MRSILPALFFVWLAAGAQAQTNVSGNQSGTWLKANSPYILTGAVTVPAGQTLTIQPGCRVLMPFNSYFNVNGILLANGTAADSIYFGRYYTSASYPYGGNFNFNSSSTNSSFSYVSMDSLGQAYNFSYLITTARSIFLTNSIIKNSGSPNLSFSSDTISPIIQNCTFLGNESSRLISANPGCFSNFSNNTNLIISPNGTVSRNSQWNLPGTNSYYRMNGSVSINSGKTLTIQPGCKVLMQFNSYFDVNGTLIANGTATDSIYFSRYYTSASYPYGGNFNFNSSSANSSLSYVSMDSLGQAYNFSYLINAVRSFTLINSNIRNSGSYSISLSSDTISPTIQNCTFNGNDNSKTIYTNSGSLTNVSNNTNAIIYPYGSINQNSQWKKQNVNSYYRINSGISVSNGKTLTIQPGCRVLMQFNSYFDVNGTLIANGAATDSIYFGRYYTSPSYPYGGNFNFNSSSANSSLSYVSMDSLGQNYNYSNLISAAGSLSITNSTISNYGSNAVYINRSSISVNQCTFSSQGSYNAIYITSDTISPTIQNNTFSGSDNGRTVYASAGSLSNFSNNTNAIFYLTSGTVSQNTQWQKPGPNSYYRINGGISISSGKTLTIQPGCRVLMPYYSSFDVSGTLIANGTVTDSIYFGRYYTSASYPYGGNFNFNASSANSSFSYVSMDSIGQTYNYNYLIGAASSLSVTNSSIRNYGSHALNIARSNVAVSQCSFSSQGSYNAFYITSDTISPTVQNNTFSGSDNGRTVNAAAGSLSGFSNNTNAIFFLPGGSISQNSQWQNPGLNSYYRISGSVSISSGKTLTIKPGCRVLMPYNSYFDVNGTLIANGTATDSIYFGRYYTSASYPYGGYFNFNVSSANSSLSYVSMDSLGYNSSFAITAASSLSVANSSIRNYSYYGINLQRSSVTVNQCSFSSQNPSYNTIYIASDTISPTVQGNTFSGSDNGRTISASAGTLSNFSNNTNAIFYLSGGTVNQNALWQNPGPNSYYRIASLVTVSSGKTLTIQPGCRVRMDYNGYFSVNGTLIANGTATDSIYFGRYYTSASYPYGGYFNINTSSANSSFSYVSMDSLGLNTGYSITSSQNFSITNSVIKNTSSSYSIYLSSDTISPTIQNCIFVGNEASRTIYANAGSLSNFSNNTNAIFYLSGSTVSQNAQWQKPGSNSYYRISGGVSIASGKTLIIQSGCRVLMPYNSYFDVNGTLIANGTANDSIYFGRYYASASYPYGGYFNFNSSSANSSLRYVSMDSLGYNSSFVITATSSLSIANSSIRNYSYYGINLQRSSITVNQCSFNSQNTSYYAIYIPSDTISPTVQNNIFSGSDNGRSIYASSKCFSLITNNTNAILRPIGAINANVVWPKQNTNSYYGQFG